MNQNALIVRCVLAPQFRCNLQISLIYVAVYRVVDHLDLVLHIEYALCALAEIVGDCRHPIALLDGIPRDRQVGPIESYKRDIGSVQGCDEWQTSTSRPGSQHLAGEHCADRVGNSVVHVQQVEIIELGDFGHARCERQIVRGVIK